jgi:hypothetical protein
MSNQKRNKNVIIAQAVLWVLGGLGLAIGFYLLLTTVSVMKLGGLAIWLIAALILHDGLLSPILFGINFLARGTLLRVSWVNLAIVQIGVIAGGVISLLVLPEIWAKRDGPANNSTLPLDYVLNLSGVWLAIAVITSLILCVLHARHKQNPALTVGESKHVAAEVKHARKDSNTIKFVSKVLSSIAVIIRLLRGFFR